MSDTYWIGGAPCAGKTTISHIIAQEFGWHVYHVDRHIESYLQRATPDAQPHLTAYKKMGLQTFLRQPPTDQLTQLQAMHAEQAPFMHADIAALQADATIQGPILIEGATLIPQDIISRCQSAQHVIWLVPTEKFLLETYPQRGNWVQDVLKRYDNPNTAIRAFENWMQRDAQFSRHTAQQAKAHDIRVLTVDGTTSLLDNAEIVMQHFGLLD